MKENKSKTRFSLTGGDRIVAFVLMFLVIVSLALAGLDALGLSLVFGELYLFLPMTAALLLVGWGLSALWRRLKNRVVRYIVGALMILLMTLLLTLALTYGGLYSGLTLPKQYAVVSDDGHSLVVLRVLDPDQSRIDARHAARLAADPGGDSEITAEDWGYTYTAYARAGLGLFYRPDSLIEGEVHIGYASRAELMVEWMDGVGHFFIKNPEIGDDGEMRARS